MRRLLISLSAECGENVPGKKLFRVVAVRLELPIQPGTGVGPMAIGGANGNAQGGGGLLDAQTGKPTQPHDFGDLRLLLGQPLQRLIDGQDLLRILVAFRQIKMIHVEPLPSAAVFAAFLAPCFVDENAPHGLGGSKEEMAPAIPRLFGIVADETQIGFVDQGGGVEGLSRFFVGEFLGGEFAQLVVDQRQQLIGGVQIALLDGLQNLGDGSHKAPR